MTATDKPIVPYGQHAEHRDNISGWVCTKCGRFVGDAQHLASWCCATHTPCKSCGELTPKCWTKCDGCRKADSDARWASLERVDWDGETPLCMKEDDLFFFSAEEIERWLEDKDGLTLDDMRLVLCAEEHPPHFNLHDWLYDYLSEDAAPPGDWRAVEKVVNDYVQSHRPLAWVATNRAVTVESVRRHLGGER